MWDWLLSLMMKFWKPKRKQLPSSNKTTNNAAIVIADDNSTDLVTAADNSITESACKQALVTVYDNSGFNQSAINKACDEAMTTGLADAYRIALKIGGSSAILSNKIFDYNARLTDKCYPIIKDRLAAIGITKVTKPLVDAIFIDTDNITQVIERWRQEPTTQPEMNLHQTGIYR